MKDYVIWLGEKMSRMYPKKTWEELMEMITAKDFNERFYGLSVQQYLHEKNRGIL